MHGRLPTHLLSLGAGVQSSTLALMDATDDPALRSILPRAEISAFADTQAEPKSVYDWLAWLEKRVKVVRATAGSLTKHSLLLKVAKKSGNTYSRALIPAYIDKGDGNHGLLARKCTSEFKVRVIISVARSYAVGRMADWKRSHKFALIEWRKYHKALKAFRAKELPTKPPFPTEAWEQMQADALIVQWIGISTDEAHRMKPASEPWIRHVWPLVEMGMSRSDCLAWMQAKGYPTPPRSACRYCPFHSDEEWARQKRDEPEEFAQSVQFERDLNATLEQNTGTARMRGKVYLHESMVPLDQVVFTDRPSHLQVSKFGNECEGLCGV